MSDAAPPTLVATCVWRCTPELVVALDRVLGDPVDAYVNGSQVWLDDDGPNAITIEWRLHPVGGFVKPRGIPTAELFTRVALAATNDEAAIEPITPADLWDGLEAFAAYDDAIEPAVLRNWAIDKIGIEPTASGLVDHEVVAAAWEQSERTTSIVNDLLAQLGISPA